MKVERIYMRVSTDGQDLTRQESLIGDAKSNGLYVAGVYKEKASGVRADRPELLRMVNDLQPDEVVIAEKIDRISRLPLIEAEKLISSIRDKGAMLSIPGIVDMSELVADSTGTAKVVLESIQELLLKLALQMARDDYETRRERQKQGIKLAKSNGKYRGMKENKERNELILKLRPHHTIKETACLVG
uniref:Site-specific recombinase, resolvase family n=2 Tax=Vibrio TaxID=662 RepID=A0A0H3ZLH7_9VIBR|nr:site-specific recombinase, resolvase family [Vibrio cyclitrophicus]AKN38279.1 putative site-specific recombinase [Vibrio splendidus]